MPKMFTFDPADYAATFAAQDYVHIPQGLTEEYYKIVWAQVEEYQRTHVLKNFAIGDKQQALYQFPQDQDYVGEFLRMAGGVSGYEPTELVISERHIKAYEADAVSYPLAHKDRHATELAIGFAVRVPKGSTLVLYPQDEREENPFNSSTEWRASIDPQRLPEVTLKDAQRIEIQDGPRDVMIFRGRSIWHMREHPAHTVMLYFKLNAFNSDPLGEDPRSPAWRSRTLKLLKDPDPEVALTIPILGRRVDYVQRRWNREWQEIAGVVLYGEKHFTIDAVEFAALRAMDGRRSLRDVAEAVAGKEQLAEVYHKVRRLAARGIVDLLPVPAPDSRRHGTIRKAALAGS
jgi:hypothetical protein